MSNPQPCTGPDLRSASVDIILTKIARGQTVWMQVKGTSMHPVLKAGDEVEVEILDSARLRFADIVAVDTPTAGLVVHRFLGWRRGGRCTVLRTKGDASPRFDPAWPEARFLGRVRSVRRAGGIRPCRRAWLLLGAARSLLVGCRAALLRGFTGWRR